MLANVDIVGKNERAKLQIAVDTKICHREFLFLEAWNGTAQVPQDVYGLANRVAPASWMLANRESGGNVVNLRKT